MNDNFEKNCYMHVTFNTVATTIVAAVAVAPHTKTAEIQTSPITFKLPPTSPSVEIVFGGCDDGVRYSSFSFLVRVGA